MYQCTFCNEDIEYMIKVQIGTDKGISSQLAQTYDFEEVRLQHEFYLKT